MLHYAGMVQTHSWHPTALNYIKSYIVKGKSGLKWQTAGQLQRKPLNLTQSLNQLDSPEKGENS